MAFSYPDPTTSDKIKTYVLGFLAAVKAFLSAIPGTALATGTVGLAKLTEKSSIHVRPYFYLGNMAAGAADIAGLWGGQLPQADQANSSKWKLVSYSVAARGATPRAANAFVVKKGATYGAASTVGTISLATLAAQAPQKGNFTEVSFSTGDNWWVDYDHDAAAGVPVYTDVTLELFWEQNHVAE